MIQNLHALQISIFYSFSGTELLIYNILLITLKSLDIDWFQSASAYLTEPGYANVDF